MTFTSEAFREDFCPLWTESAPATLVVFCRVCTNRGSGPRYLISWAARECSNLLRVFNKSLFPLLWASFILTISKWTFKNIYLYRQASAWKIQAIDFPPPSVSILTKKLLKQAEIWLHSLFASIVEIGKHTMLLSVTVLGGEGVSKNIKVYIKWIKF